MQTEVYGSATTIERPSHNRNGNGHQVASQQQACLRTQGEIEADVCEVIRQYSLEYMGRGPKDVRVFLLGDLLLVRMSGILSVAEQHLATTSAEKGTHLLKEVRRQLLDVARKELDAMIRICTFVNVLSMHHDICTATDEEIIVFTLDQPPAIRIAKRK